MVFNGLLGSPPLTLAFLTLHRQHLLDVLRTWLQKQPPAGRTLSPLRSTQQRDKAGSREAEKDGRRQRPLVELGFRTNPPGSKLAFAAF